MSPALRLSVPCRRLGMLRFSTSLAFSLLVPAAASATSLLRGPYVQSTTTNSILLVWKHSPAGAAVLEYGTTRDLGLSVTTAADTLHAVPLTGLAAGTRYWYRIRVGTQQLAGGEDFWFETARASGGVRALFFGDSGKGTAVQMAVARRIGAQDVDVVMHTGDVVYSAGDEKYYDSRFFRPYTEILRHAPIFPTPGNHDLVTLSGKAYFDNFYLPAGYNGENTYSFDWGDAHFVSVNSNALSQAVADWVSADLAASGKRWKFVYFHHAVYSCGYHGSNGTVRSLLVPVFEARGVDVVFEGHDHDYQRTYPMLADVPRPQGGDPDYVNPAGPIYIVTGGGAGCRATSSSCSFTKVALSISHCTRMQVAGDLCDIEAVDSTGTRIDRMSIRKTAAPDAPFVQLLRGNGGERWRVGRTYDITWRGGGVGSTVDLALSRDGGAFETVAAGIANDGAATWTAAGSGGSDCRLRITTVRTTDGTAIADTSDAAIVLEDEETFAAGALVRAFNFQAASQTPPEGYAADVGGLYTPEKGFGWSTYINMRTRKVHADPRLDSNAYIPNSAAALWECDVPNGSYEITAVAGDPTTTGRHYVAANGTVLLNSVTTSQSFTSANSIPITVAEGKLRLVLGGTSLGDRTSLCYLEVRASGGTSASGDPTATASASPSSGTVPFAVAFGGTATTPGSYVASAAWDFGDGGTASGSSASHTYSQAGAWSAIYTVTDGQGKTARDTVTTVAHPDTAAPRLATRSPAAGATGVATSAAIVASLVDAAAGVDSTAIVLQVDGSLATPRFSGSADSLVVTWQPAPAFGAGDTVLVALQASDRASPANSRSWEWNFVAATTAAQAFEKYVNFQPSSFATPAGYVADSGALYATDRGYGWDRSVSTEFRTTAAEERLDSYVYVTNTSTATWQIAVANGSYAVDLAVGSPTFTGLHRVEVEGTVVVDNAATGDGQFVTVNDHTATVADGFLTLRIGGIAGNTKKTKLCYVTVQSSGSGGGSTPEPNQPPSVTASANPTTGTAPLSVTFGATGTDPEGGSLAWKWKFGDGDSAAVRNPNHIYAAAGSYAAVVAATDSVGAAGRDTVAVVVSASSGGGATTEVARINFQPSSFATPAGYVADSGALYATDRGYGWDRAVTAESRTTAAEERLDSYVYVTNTSTATWQIAVANGSYAVDLAVGSPTYTGLHRVEVEGTVVVDNAATGDGQFVTVNDHTATVADGFLTVRIGGIAGNTKKTKLCYVTVQSSGSGGGSTPEPNQPPSVTASANPTTGTAPLSVTFGATGSDPEGGSLAWKWKFGDGDSAAVRNPSHIYAAAGSYAAVVAATDSVGAAGRDTVAVVVSASSGGGATTEVARINFQPSTFATPSGYTRDSGAIFSATAGFGWEKKVSTEVKTGVSDARLNSYAYVTNPAAVTWELAVGSGTYLVTLVVGSPVWTGYHRVVVEGVVVVDNVATGGNGFVTVTDVPVVVTDGRLSVRIGGIAGTSKKTKLCYLHVDRAAVKAGPAVPSVARLRVEPNPANPSAHVLLAVPAAARARIDLFDVRGRRVRQLFEGDVPAGELRVFWDGRDDGGAPAASGVYYVRAALPARRLVCKLTLLQ